MNRTKRLIYLLMSLVVVLTACRKDNNQVIKDKTMYLTLENEDEVGIEMSGIGYVMINWGDHSAIETHHFSSEYSKYTHSYSSKSTRTITLTGRNITGLVCNKIQLTDLDVSENTALIGLFCDHNLLTSVDVSKNIALTSFSCDHNLITDLDVSKNTGLTTLWCQANLLERLEVDKNTALTKLHCGSNWLTVLDVSKNVILRELLCSNNEISTLELNNNISLRVLDCNNNRLEHLDMSNNTVLTSLNCSSNRLVAESLNALFLSLHNKTVPEEKTVYISRNPGAGSCTKSLAEQRGWVVK